MQYKRSIGAMRQEDWQQLTDMLDDYLQCVQADLSSTNDQINAVKLMIEKLQHNINLPVRQCYTPNNRW